jgi:hypothetical protein
MRPESTTTHAGARPRQFTRMCLMKIFGDQRIGIPGSAQAIQPCALILDLLLDYLTLPFLDAEKRRRTQIFLTAFSAFICVLFLRV